jgi:hypothetical protein
MEEGGVGEAGDEGAEKEGSPGEKVSPPTSRRKA